MRWVAAVSTVFFASFLFQGVASAQGVEPASPPAPECVSYRIIDGRNAEIMNMCRTFNNVRFDMAFMVDSECINMQPFSSATFDLGWENTQNIRGVVMCD